MKANAIMWISWPKKSSKIETELDKATIRQFGLDGGLDDTKVSAVDTDWSGHKFEGQVTWYQPVKSAFPIRYPPNPMSQMTMG